MGTDRTRLPKTKTIAIACIICVVATTLFATIAGRDHLTHHTAFNHYALLADAWLHGRQDLSGGPPAYAMNNDFALFGGKTFVSFPPFPALLMLPWVALAGGAERFPDALVSVVVAGLVPVFLFLALERLRLNGKSDRSARENTWLSLLFACGTSFFFTAVQGTVWFTGHVVSVAMAALYLLFAIDAKRPFLAGLALGCAWMTRPTFLLATPFFLIEALQASSAPPATEGASLLKKLDLRLRTLRVGRLFKLCSAFVTPLLVTFAIASWTNFSRFGNPSPFAFGHEHLNIVWQPRIERWGLFNYHYLAKNIGIALSSLPWLPAPGESASPLFRINEHGLALWFTTPILAWVLWPRKRSLTHDALALCAALSAVMGLLYQNSGWRQFGYRFSNDYALFLFLMLAMGGQRFGALFRTAAAWSVAWNFFGAVTFDRAEHSRYYFREPTQNVVYQPD